MIASPTLIFKTGAPSTTTGSEKIAVKVTTSPASRVSTLMPSADVIATLSTVGPVLSIMKFASEASIASRRAVRVVSPDPSAPSASPIKAFMFVTKVSISFSVSKLEETPSFRSVSNLAMDTSKASATF